MEIENNGFSYVLTYHIGKFGEANLGRFITSSINAIGDHLLGGVEQGLDLFTGNHLVGESSLFG